MDRITQSTPVTDFFVQATSKNLPRKAEDKFKTLLESAVSGKQEKHARSAVERPETESPEKQTARKERHQKSAGAESARDHTQEPVQEPVSAEASHAGVAAVPQQAAAPHAATAPAAAQTETAAVANALPVSEVIAAGEATVPEQLTETAPADPRQQKFDSMLQKAAQELESAKQQPDGATTETAPEPAEAEALETELPASAEEEAAKQPELQARVNVQHAARAPVMEQKPLTAMPEEDRATLGLVQAASAPPPAPEAPLQSADVQQPAPVPQPMRMPDQTERIRAEVVRSLKQQRTEFTMRLEPETLGKIDVKMILEGGKLAVQITAASQKTAELLQRQTEQLATALRLGNVDVENIQVTSAHGASSHMEGQFGLESGQNRQTQHEGRDGGRNPGEAQPEGEQQPEDRLLNQMLDYEI